MMIKEKLLNEIEKKIDKKFNVIQNEFEVMRESMSAFETSVQLIKYLIFLKLEIEQKNAEDKTIDVT